MNGTDRIKLKRAGFRIFRKRLPYPGSDTEISIWEFSDRGTWCKHIVGANNDSPLLGALASLERTWETLMQEEMNIGDGTEW